MDKEEGKKGEKKKIRGEKGKKKKLTEKYKKGQFRHFTVSIHRVKPFCQTFFKTAPTLLEKPLYQRSQGRNRFWSSRSPAKQALDMHRLSGHPSAAAAGLAIELRSLVPL